MAESQCRHLGSPQPSKIVQQSTDWEEIFTSYTSKKEFNTQNLQRFVENKYQGNKTANQWANEIEVSLKRNKNDQSLF